MCSRKTNVKLVFITALFLLSISSHALKFGVLADTRCGELPSSGWNETGVNTGAVNAIAKEMVKDGVDLVLAGGDLIHGQFVPFDFIPLSNMYKALTQWNRRIVPEFRFIPFLEIMNIIMELFESIQISPLQVRFQW
jgi:hypothetical protein